MAELVEALAARLSAGPRPVDLRPARRVTSLTPEPGPGVSPRTESWAVTLDDGSRLSARAVVLAVPAAAAAELLASTDARLAAALRGLPTSPSAAVTLGFRRGDVPHPLDGFGFVVPAAERRSITACTWSSVKFEHRAPAGHALLRVFVGGPRESHLAGLDDETMAVLARDELREILGVTAPAVLTRVHRAWGGNPQYEVGHGGRVAELEAACPPGITLAGSAYHGVGLPACVASGRRAAERVGARLASTLPEPAGVG
jgi:oxygen-dependent protoporphyrinogen oxidase